jgi:hypothetical protein
VTALPRNPQESDNEADPQAALENIRKQIMDVGDYGVPEELSKLAGSANGFPSLMIAMLPDATSPGALEHLCVPAACEASRNVMECLPEVMKCCGADTWGTLREAKMQLRILIASTWKDDPNISLATLWERDRSQHLIPVTHACFDPLAEFFREFKI